jgi:hypothetical protein
MLRYAQIRRKMKNQIEEAIDKGNAKIYPKVVSVFKHGAGFSLKDCYGNTVWITNRVLDALNKAKFTKEFEEIKLSGIK